MARQFIIVPEFTIMTILQSIQNVIKNDYVTNSATPANSFLYQICKLTGFQRQNYFDEAVSIFTAAADHPRALNISFQYNQKQEKFPNIYIQHAGEQDGTNPISSDQNSFGVQTYDNNGNEVDDLTQSTIHQYSHTYSLRQNATFQIVITSDNSNETVMLYYMFKTMLLSLRGSGHLTFMGLENVKLSGSDVTLQSDIMPKPIHRKVLNLYFEYETSALDLNKNRYLLGAIFTGTAVDVVDSILPNQYTQTDQTDPDFIS